MKSVYFCEPYLENLYGDAVRKQVDSGWIGPGKMTAAFAKQIADLTGSPYCTMTTSGTVALSIAAVALDLLPGDEILVPAYGVVCTINSFAVLGLKPKLVDIDRTTGCMNIEHLEQQITEKTKAICYVNFSGRTDESLEDVAALCKARGLKFIEDSACAFGHSWNGRFAGTFGDVGTLSFSVPKIVTTGQGGALLTADQKVHERIGSYIDQGDLEWRQTTIHRAIGTNLRFNDILASMGAEQLNQFDSLLARKATVWKVLKSRLGNYLFEFPGEIGPLHYVVMTDDREAFRKHCKEQGVHTNIQYRALYHHPPFAGLETLELVGANCWDEKAVYLPFGLSMTEESAEYVAKVVLEARSQLISFDSFNE